jgi:hypothetical protein
VNFCETTRQAGCETCRFFSRPKICARRVGDSRNWLRLP